MTCVLRAIGRPFDVDAFLVGSELRPDCVYRRGEPKCPDLAQEPQHAASGLSLPVSAAAASDLPGQVRDALRFLDEHEDELRRLAGYPGVEEVCLEFSVEHRDETAQADIFHAELLWRMGALDIDLVVTRHAPAGEAQQAAIERERRH